MGDYLHKQYDKCFDTINDDMLDDMIEDLQADDFDKQSYEMREAYLSKLDEILQILKDKKDWDTSSKEKGYLHNHFIDVEDSKQISGLTVGELKSIIRHVVREEVSHINYYPSVPQPTWYGPTPWKSNEVWCTNNTKNSMIKPNITTSTKEQIND